MSINANITDGKGTNSRACVTKAGQLVTSSISYDDTKFIELATDATAYNFYPPKVGSKFVVTGIIAKADKQVSTSVDAEVVIYEASSATTTTADKVLFQTAMVSGDQLVVVPTNILVSEGVFLNAKTSDDDIHMTIMGYYISNSAS